MAAETLSSNQEPIWATLLAVRCDTALWWGAVVTKMSVSSPSVCFCLFVFVPPPPSSIFFSVQVSCSSIQSTTRRSGKMCSSVPPSAPSNWRTCAAAPGTKSSWLRRTASGPDASVRSSKQRPMGEVGGAGGRSRLLSVLFVLLFAHLEESGSPHIVNFTN